MTNICQAIEEELFAIQMAESEGVNLYDTLGRPSGASSDLWRQILSHPEALRIEVSLDFVTTSMNLFEMTEADGIDLYEKAPVIMYIPDFNQFSSMEFDNLNGVFLAYWQDKFDDLHKFSGAEIGWTWVQPKLGADQHISPISWDDARVIVENEVAFEGKKTKTGHEKLSHFSIGEDSPIRQGMTKEKSITAFENELATLHKSFISVLNVMNQPNYVTQTTVGSSGVRKKLEKKKGIPKERWSRIQWNVGKHVQREVRETMGEEHCTALHRVRGFYRTAKSHYNNVKKIDGKWFQWIEPFWRGHPAFGIVKSSYAPKMEEE